MSISLVTAGLGISAAIAALSLGDVSIASAVLETVTATPDALGAGADFIQKDPIGVVTAFNDVSSLQATQGVQPYPGALPSVVDNCSSIWNGHVFDAYTAYEVPSDTGLLLQATDVYVDGYIDTFNEYLAYGYSAAEASLFAMDGASDALAQYMQANPDAFNAGTTSVGDVTFESFIEETRGFNQGQILQAQQALAARYGHDPQLFDLIRRGMAEMGTMITDPQASCYATAGDRIILDTELARGVQPKIFPRLY